MSGDNACSLVASIDAEDLQRLPDPLINSVRRDVELGSDFLRGQELVNEPEAIKLAIRQTRDALGHEVGRTKFRRTIRRIVRAA